MQALFAEAPFQGIYRSPLDARSTNVDAEDVHVQSCFLKGGKAEPLGENNQDAEDHRLHDDKGNNAIVDIGGLHPGWCDSF